MVRARFALSAGNVEEAQALALHAFETCARQKFMALLAEAHSTRGAVEDAKGNGTAAQEHYALALQHIAITADWLNASSAFAGPGFPRRKFGPLNCAKPLVDACRLRLREMLGVRRDDIDWVSASSALEAAFDSALDASNASARTLDAIALVALLATQRDLVRSCLRLIVRATLPLPDRDAFERRLFDFLEIF
jgi:hypothetical protein